MTLNECIQDFVKFMEEHTTFPPEETVEAHKSLQDDIKLEVSDALQNKCTLETETNEDGTHTYINVDEFIEWLFDNYETMPKDMRLDK